MRLKLWAISLVLTATSVALAGSSVYLGRRGSYVEHLLAFNILAAAMLGMAVAGLAVALVSLARTRGQGRPLWVAALVAAVVSGLYLLDG